MISNTSGLFGSWIEPELQKISSSLSDICKFCIQSGTILWFNPIFLSIRVWLSSSWVGKSYFSTSSGLFVRSMMVSIIDLAISSSQFLISLEIIKIPSCGVVWWAEFWIIKISEFWSSIPNIWIFSLFGNNPLSGSIKFVLSSKKGDNLLELIDFGRFIISFKTSNFLDSSIDFRLELTKSWSKFWFSFETIGKLSNPCLCCFCSLKEFWSSKISPFSLKIGTGKICSLLSLMLSKLACNLFSLSIKFSLSCNRVSKLLIPIDPNLSGKFFTVSDFSDSRKDFGLE